MKRNGTVPLMKAVRRAVVERPDELVVSSKQPLLNRVQALDSIRQHRELGGCVSSGKHGSSVGRGKFGRGAHT